MREKLGEQISNRTYLEDCGASWLKQQGMADFINEIDPVEIAEWVMFEHLDMFCRENGYAHWKRQKQRILRERLMEEL